MRAALVRKLFPRLHEIEDLIGKARIVSSVFGPTWPIQQPICTDLTVTIRYICATERLTFGAVIR